MVIFCYTILYLSCTLIVQPFWICNDESQRWGIYKQVECFPNAYVALCLLQLLLCKKGECYHIMYMQYHLIILWNAYYTTRIIQSFWLIQLEQA